MEYINWGIGIGVFGSILVALYFLFCRLSLIGARVEDLSQAQLHLSLANESLAQHTVGVGEHNPTAQKGSPGKHGRLVDTPSRHVQVSYGEPSEGTEGTEGEGPQNHHYAPVPDEIDNVSLNDIDNVSEFPCDLTLGLARLG